MQRDPEPIIPMHPHLRSVMDTRRLGPKLRRILLWIMERLVMTRATGTTLHRVIADLPAKTMNVMLLDASRCHEFTLSVDRARRPLEYCCSDVFNYGSEDIGKSNALDERLLKFATLQDRMTFLERLGKSLTPPHFVASGAQ